MSDNTLLPILKQYWNFDSFRPFQEEIINGLLAHKDVLTILPTGGGKSLCYQLPAIIQDGTTLVISPLIALMNDQVQSLLKRNIAAAALHSGMTHQEMEEVKEQLLIGQLKLLYVSPERLQSEAFLHSTSQIEWSTLVVDEAHCISEWGHDFRPLYRKIASIYNLISFKNKIALTASATHQVQIDICEQLKLNQPTIFRKSIYRPNLSYRVSTSQHKFSDILGIAKEESEIIYCPTRKKTEELASFLNQNHKKAVAFHAGMPTTWKQKIQKEWTESDRIIMAATNAFGMGIDKPNVRKVIHLSPPYSLEAYYQEAGRAGRDEQDAVAQLYYNENDIEIMEADIEYRFPDIQTIRRCYEAICNHLRIETGEGIECLYILEIEHVAKIYNIPILTLIYSIKIIEQNGYWSWQNDDHSHHRARFKVTRQDLESLKPIYAKEYDLAINLLRIYGDILNYDTKISIQKIASFQHSTYEDVSDSLLRLDQLGIIAYHPAKRGSSLYFLEDRMSSYNFYIDEGRVRFLKERHKEKIKAMIAYIRNNSICRSIIIGKYFGEDNLKPCQKCDICQDQHTNPSLSNEIWRKIIELSAQRNNWTLFQLGNELSQYNKVEINDVLQKMSLEGIVRIQGTNIIFVA